MNYSTFKQNVHQMKVKNKLFILELSSFPKDSLISWEMKGKIKQQKEFLMKPKTTKNNFTLNMLVLNNTYYNCIYEFGFHD